MGLFIYNNAKNININYTLLQLNYSYYNCLFLEKYDNFCSLYKIAKNLVSELKNLILVIY